MTYVSLSQQQQQFLGGSKKPSSSSSSSGGYTPLAQQHVQFIQTKPQQVKKIAKPQVVTKPISGKNPVLSAIGNTAQTLMNTIHNLPEAHFADKENFFTPVGFVKSVAQGLINTPAEAFKGALSIGEHAKAGTSTPQQVAGDIAAAAQLPLLFVTGGSSSIAKQGVKGAVKEVIKAGVKGVAKSVLKEGAIGGGFGVLGGLQSGKNIQNAGDYIKNMLTNIGIGAATGGGLATVTHVALPLAKGLSEKLGTVLVDASKKTPSIQHIQMEPRVAQGMVINNNLEHTEVGKAILKESLQAQQTGQHVVVSPSASGKYTLPTGVKVNVTLGKPYQLKPIDSYLRTPQNINQEKAHAYIRANTDQAKQDYFARVEKEYGTPNVISADDAKYVIPGFKAEGSGDYHNSASGLSKVIYDEKLQERMGKGNNTVHFLSGGTGSGKTTAIRNAGMNIAEDAITYDTNLTGIDNASSKIDKALSHGYNVDITYVQRDPVVAFEKGVIPRVRSEGRIVNIAEHIKRHLEAFKTLEELKKKYGDQITIEYIDNTGGAGEAKVVPFDKLPKFNYTEQELRSILNKKVDEAVQQHATNKSTGLTTTEAATVRGESAKSSQESASASAKLEQKPTTEQAKTPVTPKESLTTKSLSINGKTIEPQEPVGTGKLKESRAYKRLTEHLEETDPETFDKVKNDPKLLYTTVNQKFDFENAAKIVEEDPQKAYNIAKQYEKSPSGQRWESVNIVLADRALEEKNYALWKDLEQSRSLAQTRAGQGIVAERGRFNDTSPHTYVQQVLDARLSKIGKDFVTNTIDSSMKVIGKTAGSAKAKAIAKIDQAVERAVKFTTKERNKINFAQSLLDELTCK